MVQIEDDTARLDTVCSPLQVRALPARRPRRFHGTTRGARRLSGAHRPIDRS
jgi:hypothetical protein